MKKTARYVEDRMGPVAQKVLVLLFGGLSLSLTTNPKHLFRILDSMSKDWKEINRRALHRAIKKLYQSKLLDAKDNEDGTTSIVLTKNGKQKALIYHIDTITIPEMKKWH